MDYNIDELRELLKEQFDFNQLKDNIVKFLRKNPEYDQVDFDKSSSQSLLIDQVSYITTVLNQKHEMQMSDLFINTSNSFDKMSELLRQFGYNRRISVPSHTTIKLSIQEDQDLYLQIQDIFNKHNTDGLRFPPLFFKFSDNDQNIWTNRNSILIVKQLLTEEEKVQLETPGLEYKFKIISLEGEDVLTQIQLKPNYVKGKNLKGQWINLINNQLITENLNIQDGQERYNLQVKVQNDNFEVLDYEFVQSKYQRENMDTKYILFRYNEFNGQFEYYIPEEIDVPDNFYFVFYSNVGSKGQIPQGQLSSFDGINDLIVYDRVYLNTLKQQFNYDIIDFDYNSDTSQLPVKYILSPKIEHNNLDSGESSELLDQDFQEIVDILSGNFLIEHLTNGRGGKDTETIEEIKYNFPSYIKTRDRIITLQDLIGYTKQFLTGTSNILTSVLLSQYPYVFVDQTVDKLKNEQGLKVLVSPDRLMKNLREINGIEIKNSFSSNTEHILPEYSYTSEKRILKDELENRISLQTTLRINNLNNQKFYTVNPINIYIDSISYQNVKNSIPIVLDNILSLTNDTIDIYNGFDLIKIIQEIGRIKGVMSFDINQYINSLYIMLNEKQNIENLFYFEENNLSSQKYGQVKQLKEFYVSPISTLNVSEHYLLDSFNLFLDNNILQTSVTDDNNEPQLTQLPVSDIKINDLQDMKTEKNESTIYKYYLEQNKSFIDYNQLEFKQKQSVSPEKRYQNTFENKGLFSFQSKIKTEYNGNTIQPTLYEYELDNTNVKTRIISPINDFEYLNDIVEQKYNKYITETGQDITLNEYKVIFEEELFNLDYQSEYGKYFQKPEVQIIPETETFSQNIQYNDTNPLRFDISDNVLFYQRLSQFNNNVTIEFNQVGLDSFDVKVSRFTPTLINGRIKMLKEFITKRLTGVQQETTELEDFLKSIKFSKYMIVQDSDKFGNGRFKDNSWYKYYRFVTDEQINYGYEMMENTGNNVLKKLGEIEDVTYYDYKKEFDLIYNTPVPMTLYKDYGDDQEVVNNDDLIPLFEDLHISPTFISNVLLNYVNEEDKRRTIVSFSPSNIQLKLKDEINYDENYTEFSNTLLNQTNYRNVEFIDTNLFYNVEDITDGTVSFNEIQDYIKEKTFNVNLETSFESNFNFTQNTYLSLKELNTSSSLINSQYYLKPGEFTLNIYDFESNELLNTIKYNTDNNLKLYENDYWYNK